MRLLPIVFLSILFTSCIPLSIAPTIKEDKIMVAKKFKRQLPKQYALIFEDPKEADEFYNFINTKYERNHQDVMSSVPFLIDGDTFYFSFYETEKSTKTLNLVPALIDAKRESNGNDAMLSEIHTSRKGTWYLVLTATDKNSKDCLNPNHLKSKKIENYLRSLRIEYLNTSNYLDALLRKN